MLICWFTVTLEGGVDVGADHVESSSANDDLEDGIGASLAFAALRGYSATERAGERERAVS